jgi:hypothetical protein
MCKGNYALSVKEKMSSGVPVGKDCKRGVPSILFTACNTPEACAEKGLDDFLCKNIIIFTHRRAPLSSKTATASPGRGAEPESRRRHERTISAKRVLRSRRFGSGQVRDATTSGTAGTAGERSCPSLWLFQAFVLSGTSRFRRGGLGGVAAAQTRTTRWTQVDRRSDGFRHPDPRTGCLLVLGTDRQAHSTTVSNFHSSTQYRSPVEPSKKTQLSVHEPTERGRHEELSTAYEQLRSQVLGVNGKPPRGPGLAVFLGRGMKAWIDAYRQWSARTATSKTVRSPGSTTLCTPVENEVIVLLTGMLMQRTVQEGR